MLITRETDYGIRMIMHLSIMGAEPGGEYVSTADSAGAMGIPYRFLRALSRKLVSAGLVESRRGASGGLRLSRSAAGISLMDVLRAIDPRGATLNRCLKAEGLCPRDSHCPVHKALRHLQTQIESSLDAICFAKLVKSPRRAARKTPAALAIAGLDIV